MPLVRIDLVAGKPDAYRAAISKGVQDAMVATFTVPEDDRFQIVGEHARTALVHPPRYLGVDFSDSIVIIQITCSNTRSLDQKKALYAAIADNLVRAVGMRREDVVIILTEVKTENWSFGNGTATYAS